VNIPIKVRASMIADISIFDPGTVSDIDDWSKPHQYATGFSYVIVGGTLVIDESTRTGAFPGTVLKRGL
jgi:N-acyl-D-amino-acid deacylase